jgi:hypothetical protein
MACRKARLATVVRMPRPFRHRTTKKDSRRSRRPAAALEERTDEIMDRVQQAGDNHAERAAALEEYVTLARAPTKTRRGSMPVPGARSLPTAIWRSAGSTMRLGNATRWGYAEGAEMLCGLAEKLMRSGHATGQAAVAAGPAC